MFVRPSSVRSSPSPAAPRTAPVAKLPAPTPVASPPPTTPVQPVDRFESPVAPPPVSLTPTEPPPPTFDGSLPAPGVTGTDAWLPTTPSVTGDPSQRAPATYDNVINQFAVETNPRYTPRDGNTYCNIFASDVMGAMGVALPHWVDGSGAPAAPYQGHELDANATAEWLDSTGGQYGWREVSAEEAQQLANQGFPAVATWNNPGGIGHIGVVRPGDDTNGPALAQAGAQNLNDAHVYDIFPEGPTRFYVNDQGTAVNRPTTGSGSAGAPAPSPTTSGSALTAPSMDLGRGASGNDVLQLQRDLVQLGHLSESDLATGPGTFGPRTQAAVRDFQAAHGVPAAGFYGPLTRQAMNGALRGLGTAPATPATPSSPSAAPAVQPPQVDLTFGDTGEAVRALQRTLVAAGDLTQQAMDTGPGTFGPQTQAAVKRLQSRLGVPSTGFYGPMTRRALAAVPSAPAPAPVDGTAPVEPSSTSELGGRLDAELVGTGLEGQGQAIADQCAKDDVPVDMVMAMLTKESSLLSPENTLSIANNNPGNLRWADWEAQFGGQPGGPGGFTTFPDVESGLRAMVHLLGTGYRQEVDARDWNGLISRYAPPSDGNDTALYIQQMGQYSADWRQRLGLAA
ncbi:MAG: peptidoglycan-binding protein [Myxococcaceae bacterium]|nr:peptidoglycan-binding protein [Myxococcaceae bacterium]